MCTTRLHAGPIIEAWLAIVDAIALQARAFFYGLPAYNTLRDGICKLSHYTDYAATSGQLLRSIRHALRLVRLQRNRLANNPYINPAKLIGCFAGCLGAR